jgi:hypothetical protein
MSNLHRGHSIDASYQISVVAMFVTDLDEMSNLHRGHSIDGPNLAEMFIRMSFTRFVILVQIGNPTWLPGPMMCSDWLKF